MGGVRARDAPVRIPWRGHDISSHPEPVDIWISRRVSSRESYPINAQADVCPLKSKYALSYATDVR